MKVFFDCEKCKSHVNSDMENCPSCGAELPEHGFQDIYNDSYGEEPEFVTDWPATIKVFLREFAQEIFKNFFKNVLWVVFWFCFVFIVPILIFLIPENILSADTTDSISVLWLLISSLLVIILIVTADLVSEDEREVSYWQKMHRAVPAAVLWLIYGIIFFIIMFFLFTEVDKRSGREPFIDWSDSELE